MKRIIYCISLTVIVLFSCETENKNILSPDLSRSSDTKQIKNLNDTVNLHLNDTVIILPVNISFKVVEIFDSRCPKDVYCFSAGYAYIQLAVFTGFKVDTIRIDLSSPNVVFNNLVFELVDILPYPDMSNPSPEPKYCRLIIKELPGGLLPGIVKDYTRLDGCWFIVELDNGIKLEPAVLKMNIQFKNNQRVLVKYSELTDRASVCMVGKIAEIEKIFEWIE